MLCYLAVSKTLNIPAAAIRLSCTLYTPCFQSPMKIVCAFVRKLTVISLIGILISPFYRRILIINYSSALFLIKS